MAKKSVVRKSTRSDSLDASDNVPMTGREIATALAKKKRKVAAKRRATKASAKKAAPGAAKKSKR